MTGIALGITIFACLSAGFLVGFVACAALTTKRDYRAPPVQSRAALHVVRGGRR